MSSLAEPCPPCVKKIINNGGFIAALAPELVVTTKWDCIRGAAQRLGRVSAIYGRMLSVIGVAVKVESDWEGCDQAKLLIRWIADDGQSKDATDNAANDAAYEAALGKAKQIDAWTADIWSAIADIAAGKVPA